MKSKGYSTIAGLEKLTPEEIKQRNLQTYGARIKQYRTKAGMTAEQLADALQISKSSIRNWECGLTRPDPEFLYRMFSILDVEPNDFFGFKGIGSLLTEGEKGLIQLYRSLDRRGQQDLEALAGTLAGQSQMRKLSRAYARMTPVRDCERTLAAGSVSADWAEHPEQTELLLYNSVPVRNADEVFTVVGDSMEPQFHSGDKVLVAYCKEIRNGDIGAFYVPGIGGVIKQKAYDRLHSLNPDFDDIFPYADGAKLIGRVLGRVEKDMIPSRGEQQLYAQAAGKREQNPVLFDSYGEE